LFFSSIMDEDRIYQETNRGRKKETRIDDAYLRKRSESPPDTAEYRKTRAAVEAYQKKFKGDLAAETMQLFKNTFKGFDHFDIVFKRCSEKSPFYNKIIEREDMPSEFYLKKKKKKRQKETELRVKKLLKSKFH